MSVTKVDSIAMSFRLASADGGRAEESASNPNRSQVPRTLGRNGKLPAQMSYTRGK